MDRFCRHCGAVLVAGDEFCGSCGKRVSDDAPDTGEHGSHESPGRSRNTTNIVIVAVVVLLLVIAGTVLLLNRGGDEPSASATPPVGASSAVATPSGSPTAVKPGDARLEGTYRVEMTAEFANVQGMEGETSTTVLEFDPRCKQDACDTLMRTRPAILLSHDGAAYTGGQTGNFGSTCNGKAIDSEVSFAFKAGKVVDGMVTRLDGKAVEKVEAQGGCDSAKASFSVKVFATTKATTGGSGVPAIALENFPSLNSPYEASNYLLHSWLDDDRLGAEWAADANAVNFLFGIQRKDYRLTCSGLGYLGGTHCGLLLHKMKFPIIIFELRTNDDPNWKVKTAYWNAD